MEPLIIRFKSCIPSLSLWLFRFTHAQYKPITYPLINSRLIMFSEAKREVIRVLHPSPRPLIALIFKTTNVKKYVQLGQCTCKMAKSFQTDLRIGIVDSSLCYLVKLSFPRLILWRTFLTNNLRKQGALNIFYFS